jgi:alkylation response protein AidB-like acyl-CoA dehydrogenase
VEETTVIDLAEDPDQSAIADTAARLLADHDLADGADAARGLWKSCADLGWLALGLPESAGGVGLRPAEQAVLFRELGRALAPGPFLANTLAGQVAVELGRSEVAGSLADGSVRAALAQPESAHPGPRRVRYWDDGEPVGALLECDVTGQVRLVAPVAPHPVETLPGVDAGFALVTAEVPEVPEVPEAPAVAAPPAVGARVIATGQVLTAALLAGIAERTLAMSVEHARTRVQYGKPIGAFQAVKHRCADMAVRAEAAWAITALAAVGLDVELPASPFDAVAALSVAADAALANARDNIQNHGAMGFTEEHAAQRFVKRAHVLAGQFSSRAHRRAALLAAPDPW